MHEDEMLSSDRREKSRRRRRTRRRKSIRPVLTGLLAVLVVAVGVLLWFRFRPLPGEGVAVPEYVTENLLPVNRFSRPGIPLKKIDGVVIHPRGEFSWFSLCAWRA